MKRERASELKWEAVDSIYNLPMMLEDQGRCELSDEDWKYCRTLAKRVARFLKVNNHIGAN